MTDDNDTPLNVLRPNLPIKILGSGSYLPGDQSYSHEDLLRLHPDYIEWSDEKLTQLANKTRRHFGFDTRYLVQPPNLHGESLEPDKDTSSEHLAIKASLKAVNNQTQGIAALVHGTTTSSRYTGSQAPAILNALESIAPGIEIKAGCSTSLASLHTAFSYLSMGYQNVLVSCAETLSKTINPEQLETLFLLADGAASLWLGYEPDAPDFVVKQSLYHTDGNYLNTYTTPGQLPPNEHDLTLNAYTMKGDGKKLREQASRRYTQMIDTLLPEKQHRDNIRWVIPHQVNHGLIHEVLDRQSIDAEVAWDANDAGNLGGTSVLYSLVQLIQNNKLKPGDEILLMSVGGGLSFAMQHWIWR